MSLLNLMAIHTIVVEIFKSFSHKRGTKTKAKIGVLKLQTVSAQC